MEFESSELFLLRSAITNRVEQNKRFMETSYELYDKNEVKSKEMNEPFCKDIEDCSKILKKIDNELAKRGYICFKTIQGGQL